MSNGSYGDLYNEVSSMGNTIEYTIAVNTEMTHSELRKLEASIMRILYLIRRVSGNDTLDNAIEQSQRLLIILRSVQIAIRAIEVASGPIGWLYAATSVIGVGLSGYAMYESQAGV